MKKLTIVCDAACSAACNGDVLALNSAQGKRLFLQQRTYCPRAKEAINLLAVLIERPATVADISYALLKQQQYDVQAVIRCLQQLNDINGLLAEVCTNNNDVKMQEFIHATVMHAVASIRAVCTALEAGLENEITKGLKDEMATNNAGNVDRGSSNG